MKIRSIILLFILIFALFGCRTTIINSDGSVSETVRVRDRTDNWGEFYFTVTRTGASVDGKRSLIDYYNIKYASFEIHEAYLLMGTEKVMPLNVLIDKREKVSPFGFAAPLFIYELQLRFPLDGGMIEKIAGTDAIKIFVRIDRGELELMGSISGDDLESLKKFLHEK